MQSHLGVHTLATGGPTLPYVREMVAHGLHVPVVLTVNAFKLAVEVKQASPQTVVISRIHDDVMSRITYGMEFDWFNPAAAADQLFEEQMRRLAPPQEELFFSAPDFYSQWSNELDPPPNPTRPKDPYLGYRNQALMAMRLNEIARTHGFKVAHLALNCGTPDWGEYVEMFRTGLFHQMGEYGMLMVYHEGVFGDVTPIDAGFPWARQSGSQDFDSTFEMVDGPRYWRIDNSQVENYIPSPRRWGSAQPGALCFRHRVLHEGLLKPNGVKPFKYAIGEMYLGGGHQQHWPGRSAEGDDFIMRILGRARWYNDEAAKDAPYNVGFCPFTIGGPGWEDSRYDFLYDPSMYEQGGGLSAATAYALSIKDLPAPQHVGTTTPPGNWVIDMQTGGLADKPSAPPPAPEPDYLTNRKVINAFQKVFGPVDYWDVYVKRCRLEGELLQRQARWTGDIDELPLFGSERRALKKILGRA